MLTVKKNDRVAALYRRNADGLLTSRTASVNAVKDDSVTIGWEKNEEKFEEKIERHEVMRICRTEKEMRTKLVSLLSDVRGLTRTQPKQRKVDFRIGSVYTSLLFKFSENEKKNFMKKFHKLFSEQHRMNERVSMFEKPMNKPDSKLTEIVVGIFE